MTKNISVDKVEEWQSKIDECRYTIDYVIPNECHRYVADKDIDILAVLHAEGLVGDMLSNIVVEMSKAVEEAYHGNDEDGRE